MKTKNKYKDNRRNEVKNRSRLSNYKISNNGRNEDSASDWKTQTYQKIQDVPERFEPIIEYTREETYATGSNKRNKKKNKNFSKFYNNEMNFVEAKFQNIAYEQAK